MKRTDRYRTNSYETVSPKRSKFGRMPGTVCVSTVYCVSPFYPQGPISNLDYCTDIGPCFYGTSSSHQFGGETSGKAREGHLSSCESTVNYVFDRSTTRGRTDTSEGQTIGERRVSWSWRILSLRFATTDL
jgi:hypothetical protein